MIPQSFFVLFSLETKYASYFAFDFIEINPLQYMSFICCVTSDPGTKKTTLVCKKIPLLSQGNKSGISLLIYPMM